MSSPFIGEIKMFGGTFAPKNYSLCNGQLIPIAQNTALFSILGTSYGGNGTSNFALPNLQGRSALGVGQGPGLSTYVIGEETGNPTVTLLSTEMPAHNHAASCQAASPNPAPAVSPSSNVWAVAGSRRSPVSFYSTVSAPATTLHPSAIGLTGGNLPHNNRQPYLGLTFIIALRGIFPTRN